MKIQTYHICTVDKVQLMLTLEVFLRRYTPTLFAMFTCKKWLEAGLKVEMVSDDFDNRQMSARELPATCPGGLEPMPRETREGRPQQTSW
jgi:hypothetical protein